MDEDGDRKRDMTPAQERRAESAVWAAGACLPFVYIWGTLLWDQRTSLPWLLAMLGTFAFLFVVIHLWRRR